MMNSVILNLYMHQIRRCKAIVKGKDIYIRTSMLMSHDPLLCGTECADIGTCSIHFRASDCRLLCD